jgi:hypothetical protein
MTGSITTGGGKPRPYVRRRADPSRQRMRGMMNAILFGATGMIGQVFLWRCLLDPDIPLSRA